jgi:hypothetical protein
VCVHGFKDVAFIQYGSFCPVVTPLQTGVQSFLSVLYIWIPACAGMTCSKNLCLLRCVRKGDMMPDENLV